MKHVCFVLLTVAFLSCEEKIKPSVTDQTAGPSQESWNSTVVFSDSGKVQAVLRAGHISVYADRMMTHMDGGVSVDFYSVAGEHTSVLTSQEAWVNDRIKNLEAKGNVVVTSDDGSILVTDQLFWDNGARKIHTDRFVQITTPNETIQGHGFESDQSLKYYKIFRVTGKSKAKE
ncbi:MAG: LPS export ABC transporter periplasmic protein LptC [Bacteroidota bacterium]